MRNVQPETGRQTRHFLNLISHTNSMMKYRPLYPIKFDRNYTTVFNQAIITSTSSLRYPPSHLFAWYYWLDIYQCYQVKYWFVKVISLNPNIQDVTLSSGCRRVQTIRTKCIKIVNILECPNYIWNQREKCIKKITNMPNYWFDNSRNSLFWHFGNFKKT